KTFPKDRHTTNNDRSKNEDKNDAAKLIDRARTKQKHHEDRHHNDQHRRDTSAAARNGNADNERDARREKQPHFVNALVQRAIENEHRSGSDEKDCAGDERERSGWPDFAAAGREL